MKINLKNLYTHWAPFQQRVKSEWHTFLFMPAQYWRATIIVFMTVLLIILFADAWVFWRLAHAPMIVPNEENAARFTLKRKELEQALTLLREREVEFLQQKETLPPREVFGPPSTPTSGQ